MSAEYALSRPVMRATLVSASPRRVDVEIAAVHPEPDDRRGVPSEHRPHDRGHGQAPHPEVRRLGRSEWKARVQRGRHVGHGENQTLVRNL